MSHNLQTQGENVHLALYTSGTGSSTKSLAISILDANFQTRTLLSTERLIIDDIQITQDTGRSYLLAAAAASTIVPASSTLICSGYGATSSFDFDTKEGISLPVGLVPSLLVASAAAIVALTGNGRIVEGTTQGVRPSWRESQNAQGL